MTQATLSVEQRAQLKLQHELQARTSRSIFDGRGELKHNVANDLSRGNTYLGEYLDLASVPFAGEPYGSEHCVQLARLVEYMSTLTPAFGGLGPFSEHDGKVLHAVATLYCTGRSGESDDTRYPERSAQIADKFLRAGGGSNTYWAKQQVREETCRLIYKHTDEREVAVDKRLQVFQDGVRLELARLSPNTAEGIRLLKDGWKPELFFQGWAADNNNRRSWMVSRGWK